MKIETDRFKMGKVLFDEKGYCSNYQCNDVEKMCVLYPECMKVRTSYNEIVPHRLRLGKQIMLEKFVREL